MSSMRKSFVRSTPFFCQVLPVASKLVGRALRISLPLPRTLKTLPPPARSTLAPSPWMYRAESMPPSDSWTVQLVKVRVPPLTTTVLSSVLVCNVAPFRMATSPAVTVSAGEEPSITAAPPPSSVRFLATVTDSLNVPPSIQIVSPAVAVSTAF